ncbi:hypothetical protein C2W64_01781 [Brevibacillus laterosporus]|nr:DUF2569 domain-containing protein [Brevibacillus laterosporus]RAP30585.1 hypothetical protein C2W64_01781 [Brevibacillus laterosporus]
MSDDRGKENEKNTQGDENKRADANRTTVVPLDKEAVNEIAKLTLTGQQPIGGFLYFVGFSLILNFASSIFNFVALFNSLGEAWLILERSEIRYPTMVKGIISFELFYAILLIISVCLLLFLFFRKDKRFPSYMIGYMIITMLFSMLDMYLVDEYIGGFMLLDKSTPFAYIREVVISIFWVTYYVRSKRVKLTFVHDRPLFASKRYETPPYS